MERGGKLFFTDEKGQTQELGYMKEISVSINSDEIIAKGFDVAIIETPIISPMISKKRFIKLLMSTGIQRNHAKKIHDDFMKLGLYKRDNLGMLIYMASIKNSLGVYW